MHDDLVKRLRAQAVYLPEKFSKNAELLDVLMKAADAIEELSRKYIEERNAAVELTGELASKPRWIPVTEALPEPYTWVLVSAEKHEVAFDAFYDGAQWKDAVLNGLIVTHWMPLPEPPKE